MNRRSMLKCLAGCCAAAVPFGAVVSGEADEEQAGPLKALAKRSGKLVAMFTGSHELLTVPAAAQIIAAEFDMIAVGNDLKMNRVHPQPDQYNFSYADQDVAWSEKKGLLFRGHTLVWHNALPSWFASYVNPGNARQVMTDHITSVMGRYAGKIYSWDVVNEPIHHDGRPDELRKKPWLDLVGDDYIELAFHTAAAADPKAKLILNECYIEDDLPGHAQRRNALLQLATGLKKKNVPITGVGIQGHLKADTPLSIDGMKSFMHSLQEANLEIHITELDVDDSAIPGPQVDDAVARKYGEFLDLVLPFATAITFEQLIDDPGLPKRSDGVPHRPNMFDAHYQKMPAYYAAAKAFEEVHT